MQTVSADAIIQGTNKKVVNYNKFIKKILGKQRGRKMGALEGKSPQGLSSA